MPCSEPPAIIVSLSGGKDSVAALLYLVERYGPGRLIAHYQVLPEDWEETLGYVQDVCARLDVRLVAQQILYEPKENETGVRRLAIREVRSQADVVPWGTPGAIAGVTDLALRRGWPPACLSACVHAQAGAGRPSPAVRFCTGYFKIQLLDAWLTQNHAWLGDDVVVVLGERAAESPRRARKPELWPRIPRRAWTAWNWLPLHSWSRREVFRFLRDRGIEPHPAYRAQGLDDHEMYDLDVEGGPRTSCRFCIYAAHAETCHQAQIEANAPLLRRLAEVERVTCLPQAGRAHLVERPLGGRAAGQSFHATRSNVDLTITFVLPYERRTAARFVSQLSQQPPVALTHLALAVDHRLASRRAWLFATFDVSDSRGYRACGDALKAYPYPRSDVTLAAILQMVERGECCIASFAGPHDEQMLLDAIWPARKTRRRR